MRLGIIGLPQSGKTTIFNALTRGNRPTMMSGGRFEVHTGVVDVPDERVDRLSEIFHPQKTIYAKVTYADIAGLEGEADKSGISGPLLNLLTQMDGFVHVVRCFESPNVPHPAGSVDPHRDIASMDSELLLNDLIAVERKQERLIDERRKGGGRDRLIIDREIALFEKLHIALAVETPLRDIELTEDEEKDLSGFGFLTRKPSLLLWNLSDGQIQPVIQYSHQHCASIGLQGRLEMDLVQLLPDEADLFMAEYGIEELGLRKVIRLSYELMGLQSFFTVGEDEVHAWTIQRGTPAIEAAGAIHTDLQKGFIRAEVVPFGDLVALGSMAEVRHKGKLRLEGKEYIVQDGEIVHIRFNI